ncbi:MAG: hypothetical protein R2695_18910 [Acidimicrobiales bacterium]
MDFDLDEAQQAISDLTAQILGDKSTHERLKQLAAADDRIDAEGMEGAGRQPAWWGPPSPRSTADWVSATSPPRWRSSRSAPPRRRCRCCRPR